MVSLTALVFSLLLVPFASAGMTTFILRAVSRVDAHSALSPTAQTLSALDLNHDGNIDKSEVASFADDEGLDAASSTDDFSGLDANGDGVLDSSELLQVLSGDGPASNVSASANDAIAAAKVAVAAEQKGEVAATKPILAATEQSASVRPHVVKGLAADKPTPSLRPAKLEAKISIQDAVPASVPDTKKKAEAELSRLVAGIAVPEPVATKAETPQPVAATPPKAPQELAIAEAIAVENAAKALEPLVKAPVAREPIKITPVERMVKHFAQVLRTAEVVPLREQPQKLAKKAPKTKNRATVQSAAKEVAEQLFIAEAAQGRARVLDQNAAEARANATVLAKLTTQEALNAGAAAAHKKADALLAKIAKLEDQAERAEVRSAALHSKAKLETEEATELMAVADKALNHAPSQPQ